MASAVLNLGGTHQIVVHCPRLPPALARMSHDLTSSPEPTHSGPRPQRSPTSDLPSAIFDNWVGKRPIACLGTNTGARAIPFQGWRRFKEAFAPELIARAASESEIPVSRCIDPFGGSGTTALACQFLGITPVTIEVNPYLSDLIEAKLTQYHLPSLRRCFADIQSAVDSVDVRTSILNIKSNAPSTFVEPGIDDKFIFFRDVLRRLIAYRQVIDHVKDLSVRRFFKVLLASASIPVSNVTVSGKGRRYRGSWYERRPRPKDVDSVFNSFVTTALSDLAHFGHRPTSAYTLLRGDARRLINFTGPVDLAVFSPPYPNSADYTDVYNVELWTMDYLST
jgi:hypothetical protein